MLYASLELNFVLILLNDEPSLAFCLVFTQTAII